jgi:glycosyltransferase involved in cell wall biosynthesis
LKIGFNIDSFKASEINGEIVPHGGIGIYLQELLRAMLSLEPEHEFYLIRNKPGPIPLHHPHVHSCVFPYTLIHHGVRHSGLWREWIVHRYGLDLLHEHHPDQPALRFAKIPLIITVHDLIPLIFPEKFTARFNCIFRQYVRRNLQNADAVIAVSDNTKQDLCRYHPELAKKVNVISGAGQTFNRSRNLETLSLEDLGIRKPYILNVSTIEPRKNHGALFEAFATLKQKGYPHQLVCIGAMGWKTGQILEHPVLMQYPEDIHLPGQVTRTTLQRIYSHADLMIYPTLYEGFGFPPLEAMQFGLPVIASRNSSLPEVLGTAAYYLSPHPDGAEIARAIQEIWEDSRRRKEMVDLGYAQWQCFTWEKTAAETLECYKAVAAKRRVL